MELGRNIWNLGFIKNKQLSARFLYDSGIRLNLVPDYFELYLPSIRLTAGTRRKNTIKNTVYYYFIAKNINQFT
jgi:hypothetical protein